MPADRATKARLLVVEDDPVWIAILQAALAHGGFESETAPPGAELAGLLGSGRFDALLICLGRDEFASRVRALRATFDRPIAVLTRDSSEAERIEALDAGADQVLTKPIAPGELVARIRAMLRRSARPGDNVGLSLDRLTRAVSHRREAVRLTPVEFGILECLILKKEVVRSRSEMVEHLRGADPDMEVRSLETIISKLRRKLRRLGYPEAIIGVRGQGWMFKKPGREQG